jgi:hypothetical protein
MSIKFSLATAILTATIVLVAATLGLCSTLFDASLGKGSSNNDSCNDSYNDSYHNIHDDSDNYYNDDPYNDSNRLID